MRPMSFFLCNHTATPELHTLSLHDALPISSRGNPAAHRRATKSHHGVTPALQLASSAEGIERMTDSFFAVFAAPCDRSEEHTSELQSRLHLVCRLLLEKKKKKIKKI